MALYKLVTCVYVPNFSFGLFGDAIGCCTKIWYEWCWWPQFLLLITLNWWGNIKVYYIMILPFMIVNLKLHFSCWVLLSRRNRASLFEVILESSPHFSWLCSVIMHSCCTSSQTKLWLVIYQQTHILSYTSSLHDGKNCWFVFDSVASASISSKILLEYKVGKQL